MIHLNGHIENLVPYNNDDIVDGWEITNGQTGINTFSRHVVYVGGLSADGKKAEDTRTEMQHAVLEGYVKKMIELFPTLKVAGHNQFEKKDCPSFSVVQWALGKGIDKKNIYPNWP
jgi:N-acetylmuramoyl-L-alanine amidase